VRAPIERTRRVDALVASSVGLAAAAIVTLGIYIGSRRWKDFDAALVAYAGATVLACFGVGYRYAMWLRRPPTWLYFWRGWQVFLAPSRLPQHALRLVGLFADNLFAQRFIARRGVQRWVAHQLIFWGCLLAAMVTFPLSFGWIRFETARHDPSRYEAFVFGVRVAGFALHTPVAALAFNVLDVAAALVLVGVGVAFVRRARDRGAIAVQQFANDMLPLVLLAAVSFTGVFLTVSTHVLRGEHYEFLSQLHAVTVILTLLYLPFGKFFHIVQRPAQISIKYYKDAGRRGPQAECLRCGVAFDSRMHVDDLKKVEASLGIAYAADGVHYQDVCPACRRKNLALAQDALWRAAREEQRG
jgi:hypothetical protein